MTAPVTDGMRANALVEDLVVRVEALEQNSRAGLGLGNSSLDGTTLQVRSTDGTRVVSTWGAQPDGTVHTRNLSQTAPPRPNSPDTFGILGGVGIAWNGELTALKPGDFSHVRAHLSPAGPDFVESDENLVGELRGPGTIPVTPLEAGRWYAKLVAVNTSGKRSEASLATDAEPSKVVAAGLLEGVVTDLALADAAVSAAKLAAGAVTSTAIADDAVTTPKLVAGAVSTSRLAAGAVDVDKLAAAAVTAEKIAAQAVNADKIAANAVTAAAIKAGSVSADKLAATLVLASRLIAGNATGTRVELSSSGMLVIRADGETTFSVDASTGDVTSMGEYYTARQGERLAMNVAGLSEPTLRAYPKRGNRYADLRSYTRTISSTDVANWEFRLPLIGTEAGLVDFMVYDDKFAAIASTRLRYRPFFNRSNVAHCGWAADGQNVAVVFFDGRVFITNSANTDRAPLNCGEIYSEDGITAVGRMTANNFCVRGNSVWNYDRDGSLQWNQYGDLLIRNRVQDGFRDVYYWSAKPQATSWRALKTGFVSTREFLGGRSAREAVADLEVAEYSYDRDAAPDILDTERHYGPMLDEMPDGLVVRNIDDQGRDRSTYDRDGLNALALVAIQEQDAELTALRDENTALRDQLASVVARLDRLDPDGAAA